MARPREFDFDITLDNAMQVFWDKGYEGTGISDLLRAMKIARGSLYKAFGGKRALFLAALAHYDKQYISSAIAFLSDNTIPDGSQRICQQLETIVLVVEKNNDRRGCFLCNTAVDQAPHDFEVQIECQRIMNRMENGFYIALQRSVKLGHMKSSKLRDRARSLNLSYNGLRVMVKAGYPTKDIRVAINTVINEAGLL